MKLAGVVTLYHPGEDVRENIESYAEELDRLYVVDNTEEPNPAWEEWFRDKERVVYVPFHENKGISYALNYALREAGDCEYLLTMDQDSRFPAGAMRKYKEEVAAYGVAHPGRAAMYTVDYDEKETDIAPRDINVGITSGSVLPVGIARALGGFDEALFIDEVDSEYCYRAEDAGYHIVEFPSIPLHHSIGERTYHNLFGFRYNTLNHAPIRRYYIARNKIYVARKYPRLRKRYAVDLAKLIVKILLVETDKWEKIKHIGGGGARRASRAYGEDDEAVASRSFEFGCEAIVL